jgi:hypothetical protein
MFHSTALISRRVFRELPGMTDPGRIAAGSQCHNSEEPHNLQDRQGQDESLLLFPNTGNPSPTLDVKHRGVHNP